VLELINFAWVGLGELCLISKMILDSLSGTGGGETFSFTESVALDYFEKDEEERNARNFVSSD